MRHHVEGIDGFASDWMAWRWRDLNLVDGRAAYGWRDGKIESSAGERVHLLRAKSAPTFTTTTTTISLWFNIFPLEFGAGLQQKLPLSLVICL
jgi:hypothetical protein